ncbi:hypothetical protein G7074_22870 [Pedobacter sp. HDW13]|uniref:hypothetical protein n=1 Tax=unclassified Pedobacter TaxID=2628915 RepID=UPI000F5B6274|nr:MULTISPECIES: hypothetical protein [unclassified Pedobacter]QIL41856.1 hypothetical protein G7074_22870 [Pedobacter sp. HDW13]RQO68407.1 hypothetical protein DBR40_19365 [Pedobacter sp. KBW01]
MIKQIKRKKCIKAYPIFPQRTYNKEIEDYDCFYPNTFASHILTLKSKTYRKYLKALGEELSKLLDALELDALIFLGDEKLAWRFREGKYKTFKKGMDFFTKSGIKKDFKGGLIVNKASLPQFIKHFVDLVRTNGIVQYIYFIDKCQSILGSFCNVGNIHIDLMNKNSNELFQSAICSTKFEFLSERCVFQFDMNDRKPIK